MKDETFQKCASVYCLTVKDENDKKYIMHLAECVDRAYDRIDKILDKSLRDLKP